ncbi:MAG: alpha/beta fold hydrolase [Acidobacteriota bacterium]
MLVLIHGMFGDYLDWEPVLQPLARRQRVIAIDLPGFGASDKPNREYTGEFFVDSLHGLLQELGVQRATLVGNSFGGQIALLYALRYPGEVERLILVDSGGFRPFTEEEKALTRQRFGEAAIAALTPEINEMLFAPLFTAPTEIRQRYLQKQNAKLARADYLAYAHAVASSIQLSVSTFLLDRLPEIECPTLLLWGEKDQAVPLELARQALEKLPRARLTVVPGCGHVLQLDCPEDFLQAVEGFLESPTN